MIEHQLQASLASGSRSLQTATPERLAKGPMAPPLDAYRQAGLIGQPEWLAGLENARLRRLIFGSGRPTGGHRGGRVPTEESLAAAELRLKTGRAAVGDNRILRLIDRVTIDEFPITEAELPLLRLGLVRLARNWGKGC
jgi:hypothetical protein